MPAPPRSVLVVPGHAERMHAKALGAGCDEVVFDLEDAVLPADKAVARARIQDTLGDAAWRGRRVAVRVNAFDSVEHAQDIALCRALAARHDALSVVLPKAQDPAEVAAVVHDLGGGVPLQALVETPLGLLAAPAIAALPAVRALILGYADLGAALGRRGRAGWRTHQELLVAAARAGGDDVAAIDGPHFALRDERGLTAAARAAADLGFDGKWAIHPAQIAPIARAFAPSADERAWAERVLALLQDAGAAVVDGAMVDEAMARRARRLLANPSSDSAPPPAAPVRRVAAPYYDELAVGEVFASPGLTITAGHAALHQAVIGDRLRLALDVELFAAVSGAPGVLAHPMLVCDVAIGQSTPPSGRVLGNLFYRGLGCRPVTVGATLRTRTEVVARRDASRGRGMVALRVTTVDAAGAPVLDFWRCPLLPGRPVGADDDLEAVGAPVDAGALVPHDWTLEPLRDTRLGPLFYDLHVGDRFAIEASETVTSAPELARLSLNVAMTHTDAGAGAYDRRLVYGGHVIGIAAAHLTRALPDLATILAWTSCDHRGPVFEGDRLRTSLTIVDLVPLDDGGLVTLDAQVLATADGEPDDFARPVLDWRLTALLP